MVTQKQKPSIVLITMAIIYEFLRINIGNNTHNQTFRIFLLIPSSDSFDNSRKKHQP